MHDDDWIDRGEAVAYFGVCRRTLERLGVPSRKQGSRVLARRGDIKVALLQRAGGDRNLDQHLHVLAQIERPPPDGRAIAESIAADRSLSELLDDVSVDD